MSLLPFDYEADVLTIWLKAGAANQVASSLPILTGILHLNFGMYSQRVDIFVGGWEGVTKVVSTPPDGIQHKRRQGHLYYLKERGGFCHCQIDWIMPHLILTGIPVSYVYSLGKHIIFFTWM